METRALSHLDSKVIMEAVKTVGDLASASVVITTLAGILPPLAALASIFWIGFQFYHSEPMKQWRKERRLRKEKENGSRPSD